MVDLSVVCGAFETIVPPHCQSDAADYFYLVSVWPSVTSHVFDRRPISFSRTALFEASSAEKWLTLLSRLGDCRGIARPLAESAVVRE